VRTRSIPTRGSNFPLKGGAIFTVVETRPLQCEARPGCAPAKTIARISAMCSRWMAPGYNFDGIQNPGVARLGDAPFNAGDDHAVDAELLRCAWPRSRAAGDERHLHRRGPQIREKTIRGHAQHRTWRRTITQILGVKPHLVDGEGCTRSCAENRACDPQTLPMGAGQRPSNWPACAAHLV